MEPIECSFMPIKKSKYSVLEETKDGFRITKPGRKISDLWRKQS